MKINYLIASFVGCVFALNLVLSCKQRNSSSLKDLITVDHKNFAILYYSEVIDGKEFIIRKICGSLAKGFDASSLNGGNYREQCKIGAKSLEVETFTSKWESEYLRRSGRKNLTGYERSIKALVLNQIRLKHSNGEAKTVAVPLNFDNPVNRYVLSNWYDSLEFILSSVGSETLSNPSETGSGSDSKVSSVGGAGEYYVGEIAQDTSAVGPFNVILPLGRMISSDKILVKFESKSEREVCFASLQSVTGLAQNQQIAFVRHLTQPDTFMVNVRNQVNQIRIQIINGSFAPFACRVTVKDAPDPAISKQVADQRDRVMRNLFGGRRHRLAHFMWHSARNSYARPTTSDQDRKNLSDLGWAPPRPLLYLQNGMTDFVGTAQSGAGEDFLYMHRKMIEQLRRALEAQGLKMYDSWKKIPTPADAQFPLLVGRPEVNDQTAPGLTSMLRYENQYSSANIGKFESLSHLGTYLELTIHNALHSRWAAPLGLARPAQDDPVLRVSNSRANWVWDDPNYDHLSDTYAAHVNPIFWRIHGWVDDRINEWLKAKGKEVVSLDCSREQSSRCIEWRSDVWVGPTHVEELLTVRQASNSEKNIDQTLSVLSENSFHGQLQDVALSIDDDVMIRK